MKIRNIILFIFAILFPIICNAQSILTNKLIAQKGYLHYGVYNSDNSNVYSITYKLYNESDNVIWLWFEKEDLSELSDSIKARRYFYKRKGDFSLYHLALDGNVASMAQSVFGVFVKRIGPKEHFIIQVISKKEISESCQQKTFQFLDKHIVALSEKDLSQYVHDLKYMDERIFFKEEFISLFLESLF
jgi:hypothetical protein